MTLYHLAFKRMKESVRGRFRNQFIVNDCKSPLIDGWVFFLEEWEAGGSCFVLEIPHREKVMPPWS